MKQSWSVAGVFTQMMEIFKHKILLFRATVIGIIVGIIPGAGCSIASFVAHDDAKRFSKNPSMFGKGSPEGVIAS